MTATDPQQEYIKQVLVTLQNNPTSAELDYLVSAFTNMSYLAATAQSDAEMAEAQRKYEEATCAARIREDALVAGQKISADVVASKVAVETYDYKKAEIKAYEKARKIKGLQESVEQAINAIKHLERTAGPTADVMPGRR